MPSMETLHQLANESFSYGWLTTAASTTANSLGCDGSGLMSSLHRADASATDGYHEFDFGLPSSRHSSAEQLVHADKIFSNGLLLPLHLVKGTSTESSVVDSESPDSFLRRSLSLVDSLTCEPRHHSRSNQYTQSRILLLSESSPLFHSVPSTPVSSSSSSSSKLKVPFLRKYFCFLMPLCKKLKRVRLISPKPVRTSPMTGTQWSGRNAVAPTGEESSIYEAVLHCKRSSVVGAN